MNAPAQFSNPTDMLVSDDGDIIRVTVRGSTYVFGREIARTVRAARAQHDGAPSEVSAFWNGYLTCLFMATTTKGNSNGEER